MTRIDSPTHEGAYQYSDKETSTLTDAVQGKPDQPWSLALSFYAEQASCGVPALHVLHQDLIAALKDLVIRPDHEFGRAYRAFTAQAEHAFRQEEQWMEDSEYEALKAHQEQHARVLGTLHTLHIQVMAGEFGTARRAVGGLLPQWLAFHFSTMDATLGVAMQIAQAETTRMQVAYTDDRAASLPC